MRKPWARELPPGQRLVSPMWRIYTRAYRNIWDSSALRKFEIFLWCVLGSYVGFLITENVFYIVHSLLYCIFYRLYFILLVILIGVWAIKVHSVLLEDIDSIKTLPVGPYTFINGSLLAIGISWLRMALPIFSLLLLTHLVQIHLFDSLPGASIAQKLLAVAAIQLRFLPYESGLFKQEDLHWIRWMQPWHYAAIYILAILQILWFVTLPSIWGFFWAIVVNNRKEFYLMGYLFWLILPIILHFIRPEHPPWEIYLPLPGWFGINLLRVQDPQTIKTFLANGLSGAIASVLFYIFATKLWRRRHR